MSESQEITLTIVGEEIAAAHPELHHYTDEGGLAGIIESNTLWASHYRDLNDSTEIVHLREPLRAELTNAFRTILQRRRRSSLKIERRIVRSGGILRSAAGLAEDLVNSLYGSAIQGTEVSELSRTAGTPFVVSLCSHSQEPYERDNGLLSQWRGYGRGGGYCLVIDTARIGAMLGREFDAASYTHLKLHPAHYAVPDIPLRDAFPQLFSACEHFVDTVLDREPDLGPGIEEFFVAATVVKHRAFYEEREVRIVATPMTPRFRDLVHEERPDLLLPPQKEECTRADGRRYVVLFEALTEPLPIRRVIVGPSADQQAAVRRARHICGDGVPIVPSATPFKG